MDKQQQIRKAMIDLVARTGVKYRFISNQTGISPQLLSKFKNGFTNLGEDNIELLEIFLLDAGISI